MKDSCEGAFLGFLQRLMPLIHMLAPGNSLPYMQRRREDQFLRWTPDVFTAAAATGKRSKWADGLAACTQLDLQGEMLELCVPPASVRAADGHCGCVENALKKKKKKWKWEKRHYFNIFLKCCEFICFSYLKRSGSVNCVYIFMVFTYRCNFFFFPNWRSLSDENGITSAVQASLH